VGTIALRAKELHIHRSTYVQLVPIALMALRMSPCHVWVEPFLQQLVLQCVTSVQLDTTAWIHPKSSPVLVATIAQLVQSTQQKISAQKVHIAMQLIGQA
jgi:hypothetical protein